MSDPKTTWDIRYPESLAERCVITLRPYGHRIALVPREARHGYVWGALDPKDEIYLRRPEYLRLESISYSSIPDTNRYKDKVPLVAKVKSS